MIKCFCGFFLDFNLNNLIIKRFLEKIGDIRLVILKKLLDDFKKLLLILLGLVLVL